MRFATSRSLGCSSGSSRWSARSCIAPAAMAADGVGVYGRTDDKVVTFFAFGADRVLRDPGDRPLPDPDSPRQPQREAHAGPRAPRKPLRPPRHGARRGRSRRRSTNAPPDGVTRRRFGGGDGDVVPFGGPASTMARAARARAGGAGARRAASGGSGSSESGPSAIAALQERLERDAARAERLRRERRERTATSGTSGAAKAAASRRPSAGGRVRPEPSGRTPKPAAARRERRPSRRARIDPGVKGPGPQAGPRRGEPQAGGDATTRSLLADGKGGSRGHGRAGAERRPGLGARPAACRDSTRAAGTPVPGEQRRRSSASTRARPPGLHAGLRLPARSGPHDFGDAQARFGARRYGHVHEGQDIFGKTGTPEVAVHDGVVVDRGKNSGPATPAAAATSSPSTARRQPQLRLHAHAEAVAGAARRPRARRADWSGGSAAPAPATARISTSRCGSARRRCGAETKPVDPLPYLRQWPQPRTRAERRIGSRHARGHLRAARRGRRCSPSTGPSDATRSIRIPPTSCSRPIASSRTTTRRGS